MGFDEFGDPWLLQRGPQLVEMFRAPIYDGWLPGRNTLLFSVLAGVLSLVVGWLFYAWKIEDYGTRH